MSRWLTPVIFAALAAYVWNYNATHDERQLLLPFVDVIFAADADDPKALGQRSVQMAVALCAVAFAWAAIGQVRDLVRRRRVTEEEPTESR